MFIIIGNNFIKKLIVITAPIKAAPKNNKEINFEGLRSIETRSCASPSSDLTEIWKSKKQISVGSDDLNSMTKG